MTTSRIAPMASGLVWNVPVRSETLNVVENNNLPVANFDFSKPYQEFGTEDFPLVTNDAPPGTITKSGFAGPVALASNPGSAASARRSDGPGIENGTKIDLGNFWPDDLNSVLAKPKLVVDLKDVGNIGNMVTKIGINGDVPGQGNKTFNLLEFKGFNWGPESFQRKALGLGLDIGKDVLSQFSSPGNAIDFIKNTVNNPQKALVEMLLRVSKQEA